MQIHQNNSHKQDDAPPPVSKRPKKQKFTEKRQLRTINENKEICQKPKDLLCTNPEETKEAEKLMNEAVEHLEQYATSRDGYESREQSYGNVANYYKKKHEAHIDVLKANLTFENQNKYDALIGMLWDPDSGNLFNNGFVKRKIARVYNPNLVIIQQRYKDSIFGRWKYFYALLKKAQISEDKTIIGMTSANIIDHNPSKNEYKNTIIENANLFTTEIDSEEDIKKGKLKKVFVNIAGYLIENKNNNINITYVESINSHASF
ncbi:Acidic phosphoprotein precursor PCEMA1, putative [Plasmodium chabaudi adami]|uniref:Acidic phosphoprotein PCEMA1, putative n=1 Tax=Plasmodium chabaudi adami TaxID=5826 RepID=A0A1D3L7Z0_PLACE|nr:Acidic phosphoprotein precursor PCEMA1, putative [Plasmodium chabaudi adami]